MLAFIIRRLFEAVLVLLAVAFIAFSMFQFVGDPVANMLGQEATVADRADARQRLGLDQPVPVQFARFVGNVLSGDFGVSYRYGRKVSTMIAERLPATLELALTSALVAAVSGIVLGIYTAIRREGWLSRVVMTASLIGVSVPTFLIGIALIYLFAVELRWLPSFGRGETVQIGWWSTGLLTSSGLRSLILPAATLALFQMTLVMRLVRTGMLEVLRADYIKFARARGLSERRIYLHHALKNTLVPVVTVIGLQVGVIIAFSIVTETVFQWPGVGLLFISAVQFADTPVISAYLLLVAAIFVAINLAVDLICYAIDPRVRIERPVETA
jgi:peptide/nickel transport system permease protein